MDETKLRERLSDVAGDVRPVETVPDGLVPRAKRRAVLTPAASVLGAVAILAVSVAGVRTIMRAGPTEPLGPGPSPHIVSPKPNPSHPGPGVTTAPATEHSTAPSTAPSVVPEPAGNDRITVVLADGDVVAIDPDQVPAGAASLGMRDHAVPLAWAPDGRIAFTVSTVGGLWEMDPSGHITEVYSNGTVYGASYSPDGTELVYAIANGAGSDVRVVSGDSANGLHDEILVGDPSTWNVEPTWAPDGQTIAFLRGGSDGSDCIAPCSPEDDRDLTVWAIDRDGSNLRSISEAAHGRTGFPMSWSPDGTQLAVTVWSGAGTPQIYVVSVRTGQVYRVTSRGQGPAWSPNGGAIAFVTLAGDGTWTVHLVDTDGENERPLVTPPVDPSSSVLWSRFPAE